MNYREIRSGINEARKKAYRWNADINKLKLIVFSDHHRGTRDGADDFLPCEKTYKRALNYYLRNNYTLLLLGDVEELWENAPIDTLHSYPEVLSIEKEFFVKGRFLRIWGNHDDVWRFQDQVKSHFKQIFKCLKVYESAELTVHDQDEELGSILFVHGHQGTMLSSKYAGVSKFFVRFFWRPVQRFFRIPVTTASKNEGLRYKTDHAMDLWASIRQRQLIVCGHTHQYIFGSYVLNDKDAKPCYFNTGCCSYGNGNISGVEISNGKIRLIEWTDEDNEPFYITKAPLKEIFDRCE